MGFWKKSCFPKIDCRLRMWPYGLMTTKKYQWTWYCVHVGWRFWRCVSVLDIVFMWAGDVGVVSVCLILCSCGLNIAVFMSARLIFSSYHLMVCPCDSYCHFVMWFGITWLLLLFYLGSISIGTVGTISIGWKILQNLFATLIIRVELRNEEFHLA